MRELQKTATRSQQRVPFWNCRGRLEVWKGASGKHGDGSRESDGYGEDYAYGNGNAISDGEGGVGSCYSGVDAYGNDKADSTFRMGEHANRTSYAQG